MVEKQKVHFPEISPKAWEHPTDRAALAALQSIPGISIVLKKFISLTTEKSLRLMALSNSVRVSENQFPRIHTLLHEACEILDAEQIPEIYISENPFLNAGAVGVENPFITLNSRVLDLMDDDQVLGVIAHELAHCMSGHVLYKTLLVLLLQFSFTLTSIPLGGAALSFLISALREWDRKSELSADRASLLVVQNPDTLYEMMVKMACGRSLKDTNLDEFIKQAEDYEAAGDLLDSAYKLINLATQSHPFPVLRLSEMRSWIEKGEYDEILKGAYRKRTPEDDADEAGVFEEAKGAANQYYDDIKSSKDPLANVFNSVEEGIDSAVNKTQEFFSGLGFNFGEESESKDLQKPDQDSSEEGNDSEDQKTQDDSEDQNTQDDSKDQEKQNDSKDQKKQDD